MPVCLNAQSFTTLHNFTGGTNGANPYAGLVISGNTLFGTTDAGGSNNVGTVFAVNTDGSGFTILHSFAGSPGDGSFPVAGLVLSGNSLFGTASQGGSNGVGTVFAINTDGSGYTNLHHFSALISNANNDGANPVAGLIVSNNTLYGTASNGGTNGSGTVFAINTDGSGFTDIYSFTAANLAVNTGLCQGGCSNSPIYGYENNDGANPHASLVLSGNTLYGTTQNGGLLPMGGGGCGYTTCFAGGCTGGGGGGGGGGGFPIPVYVTCPGTVFAVNTDGSSFRTVFNANNCSYSDPSPRGGSLVLSSNLIGGMESPVLYGTASQYEGVFGSSGGMVFEVGAATPGTGYFSSTTIQPSAGGLVLSGNTLYGTTQNGGSGGSGTVFATSIAVPPYVGLSGNNLILHNFPALINNTNSDGANLRDGLILSGNTLYGTASQGGTNGFGTVFALTLPMPSLSIALSNNEVVISWPLPFTGPVLQQNTNLTTTNWITSSYSITTANGTNSVTIAPPTGNLFFRLAYFSTTTRATTPEGMALIPAGSFMMGNFITNGISITNDPEITDASPTSVTVSAFYMETNLVSYSQWQTVYNWAVTNGFVLADAGNAKAANFPVSAVNWYDSVKWCNARSQKAGLTPVYYTDPGMTRVYTNGETDAVYPNWAANGYRLPTEAEYEKAARGGLTGQRFPWGNIISESQANYYGDPNGIQNSLDTNFDLGPYGNNAVGISSGYPGTTPVGHFSPNGCGLYDMAGNIFAWCWDWYGTPYAGGTDPRGPASGSSRVIRGGNWNYLAIYARCAYRHSYYDPHEAYYGDAGVRCVRGN